MTRPTLPAPGPDEAYYLRFLQDVDNLPPYLQRAAIPFRDAAETVMQIPDSPDRVLALQHLLASRDAALRALHLYVSNATQAAQAANPEGANTP